MVFKVELKFWDFSFSCNNLEQSFIFSVMFDITSFLRFFEIVRDDYVFSILEPVSSYDLAENA